MLEISPFAMKGSSSEKNVVAKIKSKQKEKDEAREKKQYRAMYSIIMPPPQFLNPHKIYQFFMNNTVCEEDRQIVSRCTLFNHFKLITKVQVIPQSKVISATLIDAKSYTNPSWEYVVERLKSFGDEKALDWANTIENFSKKYQELHKSKELQKFIWSKLQLGPYDCSTQNKVKESLINNYFVYASKYKLEPHGFELISVGYNENMALQLGYDSLVALGEHLLRHGLIDFYCHRIGQNANYKAYLKNFFETTYDESVLEKPQWLQTKTGQLIPVMRSIFHFPSINEKKQLELDVYNVSRLDSTRAVAPSNDPAQQSINPAFARWDRTRENELNNFLKIYYGVAPIYKCQIAERTCTVRELNAHAEIDRKARELTATEDSRKARELTFGDENQKCRESSAAEDSERCEIESNTTLSKSETQLA
jgi:hypothetical protein